MQYTGTRNDFRVNSRQAVLDGLTPDGGLYMPLGFPQVDVSRLLSLSFEETARVVFDCFLDDFEQIPELVHTAYAGKFDCEEIAPLKKVGDRYVLELFHGPTCAFKDVALSALPVLMRAALQSSGAKEDLLILTATSGDTGKAAMEGFKDVPGTRILVFYPYGGVSPVQERQMTTQAGQNVRAAAIRGNFDDAQTAVKEIFVRAGQNGLPADCPVRLSSANSINIGRLVPQIVYYFTAYAQLVNSGEIKCGDPVNFAVPTGNFGDILAGYFAKKMGLPVGKLLCASNANDVLTDFIHTGLYNRKRPFFLTTSPSMDILVSSNLERLLYLLSDRDTAAVTGMMQSLKEDGVYQVDAAFLTRLQQDFAAARVDDAAAADAIRSVWDRHRYLMDPHTAVAWSAADVLDPESPTVILSTASPFKFPETVLKAVGAYRPADPFTLLDQLSSFSGLPVPAGLKGLKDRPVRFRDVIEKDGLYDYVLDSVRSERV